MEFWATWCPNCHELEPTLLQVAKKYAGKVQFVGVAVSVNETPARVKAFVAKHGLPGAQYFDTEGNATGAYDAPATSYPTSGTTTPLHSQRSIALCGSIPTPPHS